MTDPQPISVADLPFTVAEATEAIASWQRLADASPDNLTTAAFLQLWQRARVTAQAAEQRWVPVSEPTISRELLAFLRGARPLGGVWFGEKHPTEPGLYWWRKHLPTPPQEKRDE